MIRESEQPAQARDTGRIARPQLERRAAGTPAAPIAVLVGPAGSGKSDIVRASLAGSRGILFRVGYERRTFARFVHGLAQAIAPVAPGAQAAFPRAWERSLQSRSPATALAHWLAEHIAGIDLPIAIDDMPDAAADTAIATFIAKLAELRASARLTIAVRSVGALPIALWMATRQMERPIDATDLCFSANELAAEALRLGLEPDAATLRNVFAATGGLPIAVRYGLTRLLDDPRPHSSGLVPSSFEGIAAAIFARRTKRERDFLLNAALLPSIEDDALKLLGWTDPHQIRAAMGSDGPFMWERDAGGRLHFHDRFRAFLDAEFQARDAAFRSSVAQQAMTCLSLVGRHAAALGVVTRQPIVEAMTELLDSHGFEILESGEVDVIDEALTAVTQSKSALGPGALALRGYLEARLGHADTAEAWFRLALDHAEHEASRVTIALHYARELGLRRREDACEILEAFAASTNLPRPVLIDVRSSFGRALSVANRHAEARIHTDEAIALLDERALPALRARVLSRAAVVAFEGGQTDVARKRALVALPLAAAHSLYEVAASAHSILYNIAYDIDDDAAASMDRLRCMRDMGVKAGHLRIDLHALLGMYELCAEAGDRAALSELERELALADAHDATIPIMEGLLPAKALQAGWSGDFDAAQRLLRPSADHQGTPARRALCWAQIRLYSAAAGDMPGADEALRAAEAALGETAAHERHTTQFGQALLNLALGALICRDVEAARRWADAAAAFDRGPRLRALRAAVGALIMGSVGPEDLACAVPGTLAALRSASFGGLARLIEALPYSAHAGSEADGTIAGALAQRELSARFAAAVDDADTGALKAWLDTAPAATFQRRSLGKQFEDWAGGHNESGDVAQVGKVRREIAGYHHPAPPVVGLIDDVDAALDALFERLGVASPLMAEHSRAVAAWCTRLARLIGRSETEITFATRCGLIHDVGKIRTPASILDAPRALTTEEWAIMRAHSTDGAAIVARVPLLASFVPIVRGHHERLDGKGYPDGLRLGTIPITARIVAVADCFNAMIGRRPYRPAMAPTEALNELERHRGTHFDPEIVEAMVQIVLGRQGETAA